MADLSINLPTWAFWLGYRAEGDYGTYGNLSLFKKGELVKEWSSWERQPNIFELEEFIKEYESEGEECLV
jgi:hypothetical protein